MSFSIRDAQTGHRLTSSAVRSSGEDEGSKSSLHSFRRTETVDSHMSEGASTFVDEIEPREALASSAEGSSELVASIKTLPVTRLLTLIDSKTITSKSIERATKTFRPSNNDVVIVGSGIVGESIVTRMVRLLGAKSEREVGTLLEPTVGVSNAPIIESSVYDSEEGMKILNSKQAPFTRRVFRTSLTHKALQERLTDATSKVKYVVVLRNPKDARLVWHDKCRRNFATLAAKAGDDKSEILAKFDSKFSADDFIDSPGTHVVPTDEIDAYESNLSDWITHPKSSNVLIVLMEEILAYPERVLDRLALHLGYFTDVCTDAILDAVSGRGLLKSKRCQVDLTHEQMSYLQTRFSKRASMDMRLKPAVETATNVSSRGIFVDTRPISPMARRAPSLSIGSNGGGTGSFRASHMASVSEASEVVVDEIPHLSHESLLALREKWIKTTRGTCSSYESLYSRLTGDEYPYAESAESPDSPDGEHRRSSIISPFASSLRKMVSKPRMILTRGSSTDLTGMSSGGAGGGSEGPSPSTGKTPILGRGKSFVGGGSVGASGSVGA